MNDDVYIIDEWLRFANMDLDAAKFSFKTMHPAPLEIICFHCQQAAEKFLKSIFHWLQKDHYSLLCIYLKFRKADVRSWATKRGIYKTAKEKMMNFDLFLPPLLGFCYKYLLWRIRVLKRGGLVSFY